MNPRRQVRRSDVRPSYARRSSRPKPRLQLPAIPTIQIGWARVVLVGAAALLLLIGVGKLTAITHVRLQGLKTLDTEHMTSLTESAMKQQWFGRNLVLLNTGALEHALTQAEPGVKSVSVDRKPLHTITVTVAERQPSLNWKTGETTYLLDADATVIGPTKPPYDKLPVVTDSSRLPVKAGDRVAPTAFVAFCKQLASLLPPAGYVIAEMTVPESTSEVYARTDKNVTLKFDTTRPAGEEVEDLKAVQRELARSKKAATQYIDLRIEHKAYYK